MSQTSHYAEVTSEYNEIIRRAKNQSQIPTIPLYPIPNICEIQYCNDTPSYTINGLGLCTSHFLAMVQDHLVKIRVI